MPLEQCRLPATYIYILPVKSLDTEDEINQCGVVVCRVVPVAAVYSAGIVAWRIRTGTVEGLLQCHVRL